MLTKEKIQYILLGDSKAAEIQTKIVFLVVKIIADLMRYLNYEQL